MSFAGFSFVFWRIFQIITLIPIVGMLSWFVRYFTETLNQLTPDKILVLFIVSVLALAWAIGTLFLYSRAKHSAKFVAFVDLLIFGALIASVVLLRHDGTASCSNFDSNPFRIQWHGYVLSGTGFRLSVNKVCAMLKASWAFAIMNIIFFAFTTFFAWRVHSHHKDERVVKRETTHVTRHHSHRSSRSPRRSHHSSRRSYHV